MINPSQALAGLLKAIEGNRNVDSKSNTVKPKNWLSAIIIFITVLIATFVFAYASSRNSKELAKLRHEKNKRKIESENKEALSIAAKNDITAAKYEKEINALQKEIDTIDEELVEIEHARERDHKAIKLITSWRDI